MFGREATNRPLAVVNAAKALAEGYFPPSQDRLAEGLEALEGALETLGPAAAAAAAALCREFESRDGKMHSLAQDHAALFVGPYQVIAPPYGSVYLEGGRQVMGVSTLAVAALYSEAGLDLAPGLAEPPDHISAELEFLAHWGERALVALAYGDEEAAAACFRRQAGFFHGHLGAWAPEFTSRVENGAATGFYRELARCTRIFLEVLGEYFQDEDPAAREAFAAAPDRFDDPAA
ncbi:MAG: molecular chaperone TorD family protein [Thermodesulfobacteriota bacterium]